VKIKMVTTYLRRAYSSFATHVVDNPPRLLSLLFLALLACVPILLPAGAPSAYLLSVLTTANIMAILASSWDLLVGRCGQISLGHALFFGIGAYTSALLIKYIGFPLWISIPAGVLVGTLTAVPVGFPAIKVKGPYLALVTMALPMIATGIVYYFRDWTGGEHGLMVPRFFPFLDIYQQQLAECYLTLILLFISATIMYKIASSKIGIVFVSILDNEVGAKACGINVTKYKLLAFVISACFASLAGGIHAHFVRVAGPSGTLSLTLSFQAIIITMLGGIGTIYGPIAGSYIIYFLDQYVLTRVVNVPFIWHPLIFMVIVVIFVIKWPRGIARFVTDELEDLSKEREIEERGPHIWKEYKRRKEKK
jgi:branched-chain amino acid transport system permease protein